MPSTVDVPDELRPVFRAAEELVAQHFAKKRERPEEGTIDIDGERYVLVRAASLSERFFKVVREIYGPDRGREADDFARNILFDLAHAVGRSDAEKFAETVGDPDPIRRLSAGPVHFAFTGWAKVHIFEASRPSPDDDYFLIYDHPYSFESDAWLRSGAVASFPVCIMNSGYSSGWCEASFGVRLVATEVLCRACGDEACRFLMAPPHRIEEHVDRWAAERRATAPRAIRLRAYQIPDLFARKSLEDRLRQAHDELEARVVERTAALEREMESRKEVERQLRQSQKMEAIGRLSGGIAHDFNNVLGVILGCTDILERKLPGDEAVDLIRQASTRAAELTGQLLAFSRAQLVQPDAVDLDAIVEESVRLVGKLLGEPIELVVDLAPGPLVVWASAGGLQQVLLNLCLNARDAMPEGGRLTLRTARVGDACELVVEDTGVGMDEATRERIFDPFFTTKGPEGTGLGLSTAHGIVSQLDGTIAVESAPGQGSRFVVRLPAIDAPPAAPARPPTAARPRGAASILLVEDDEHLRRVVLQMLVDGGHRVVAKEAPAAALAWLDEGEAFDLLVTDVVMPKTSGRVLADAVVARRPGVRVLYMSGYADDDALRRGLLGPGASCLHKPFDGARLLEAVDRALER